MSWAVARDFRPAQPGPGWMALPLAAIILDARGRIAAMNDAAEPFLNMSSRSSLGQFLEAEPIAARVRISPPLGPMIAKVAGGHDALSQPAVRFDIGDRSGGHHTRLATIYLGPVEDPAGGVMMIISPTDTADRLGRGLAARTAARSAIGMAEMLAHEIKNPLAGIRGAAQLLAMSLPPDEQDLAELIVAESRRIVALLEEVERFGDTSAPVLAPVNLHNVLDRARRSAGVGFARGVRLVTDYDPSLPAAMADADKLVQVFLNLLKNAAEAMERAGHQDGTIRIRTFYDGTLRLAPTEAEPAGRALPLQVEVEDDGPGIPEGIAEQIFDPFVSGRENGTGLGLALVSKIVTDHRGFIGVESRPGRTVFRISLPKAEGET
ncbi:two-component system sensor histidine kinase NtrB [Paracoccus pacificus]|uniref:histidine kinase n=1 Tax=Paracoccus pacificus TaxID=1463598 RepID=A0ABW4R9B4_9RHOB